MLSEQTHAPILEVEGLRKCYGKRPVVENVGLHVQPGEIVGQLTGERVT